MPSGTITPVSGIGTFTGGTITGGIVLSTSADPLLQMLPTNPAESVSYGQDGRFTIGINDTTGGLAVLANNDSRQAFIFEGNDPLYTQNATGAQVLYARADTYTELNPIIDRVTVPADGDLVAGQLALWFDDTNGAAKLMVKAKQADGTVKTAAIALS